MGHAGMVQIFGFAFGSLVGLYLNKDMTERVLD
jgi:hypothetical protein